MPIADQAYIRTSGNHVTLHKFKEPVPTSSILILNECECDRKHLVVAINTKYRKRVLKRPDACTKAKEDSLKNAWSSDQTREVPDIEMASGISLHSFGKHTRQEIGRA